VGLREIVQNSFSLVCEELFLEIYEICSVEGGYHAGIGINFEKKAENSCGRFIWHTVLISHLTQGKRRSEGAELSFAPLHYHAQRQDNFVERILVKRPSKVILVHRHTEWSKKHNQKLSILFNNLFEKSRYEKIKANVKKINNKRVYKPRLFFVWNTIHNLPKTTENRFR
jgi:hypothetical protein